MSSLPDPIRTAFQALQHHAVQLDRGANRNNSDRTMDSRAENFSQWLLHMGLTAEHLASLTSREAIPILAVYAKAVGDSFNLRSRSDLQPKSIVNYVNAAHSYLQVASNSSIPIKTAQDNLHPIISDTISFRRKWHAPNEQRLPITQPMFEVLHKEALQQLTDNIATFTSLSVAVYDWERLSIFTGSRVSEYAQTNAKQGTFAKVPVCPNKNRWTGTPIAFIAEDFTFLDSRLRIIPHTQLRQLSHAVHYLHLRFRYDKSSSNFVIRKFVRANHPYLCPIQAAIAIILRAQALCIHPDHPVGAYLSPRHKGHYLYIKSTQIIAILRKACVTAYPDPAHFYRQNISRIVAHSNRVTAAVALNNMRVSIPEIAFRLRWKEPSVSHYLRETDHNIGELTAKAIQGALVT